MKLHSPMRYIPLALMVYLYLSSIVFAQQTTLVGYNFNQNLSHYTLDGSVVQTPPTTLSFTANGTIPVYENSTGNYRLQTDNTNDYLELRINTTGQANMSIKFDANMAAMSFGLSFSGRWVVQSDNGSNGATWTQIGNSESMTAGNILFYSWEGNTSASIPVPVASENQTEVRFRIHPQENGGWGNYAFRIDNLRIEKGTPNISVFANGATNTPLPHNVEASIAYDTDFGNAVTVGGFDESSFFRIRNLVTTTTGAPNLTLNSISVTGTHASDFEIFNQPNFPSTIQPTTNASTTTTGFYRQFKVRFTPTGDGLRTAEIHINSNGNRSPYIIKVMGQGASCSLFTTPYVVNEFNPVVGNPTLPSNINSSWFISGTASGNGLYPRTSPNNPDNIISLPTYSPGSPNDNQSAWVTLDGSRSVEFGGTNGIDVSGLKDVSIAFNVGAYSTSSSSSSGPNYSSTITLQVEHNGTWTDEVILRGRSYNIFDSGYNYVIGNPLSGNNYYEKVYSGSSTPITNGQGGVGRVQTIRLNIPASKISNDPTLKFRIVATTPDNNRIWIIDNVRIDVKNSEFTERTASGWTNGTPNANKRLVIPSGRTYNVPQATGLEICECEVKAGGRLNVGAESNPSFLQVRGKIIVEEGGVLEVRTNSNLVQIEDDAVNSGNIIVNRHVSNVNNDLVSGMDYIYWSSPVSGQQLKAFSPNTPNNRFYRYEESNDYFYPVNNLSNFQFGKGYAIRAEDGLPNPYNKTYQFTGVPHNGTQYDQENLKFIKSADGNGYNLIGNPYPSNIHADDFLTSNPGVFPTVFFWQNNDYIAHQQGSGYYGSNYAVYNLGSGGVPGTYDANSTIVTDGTIKSTQGFIVQVKPEGDGDEIIFKNSMRRTANSGTFYQKFGGERDRFWLTLTNYDHQVNTTLIAYVPGATDGFEQDFDVEVFSEGSDAIYTVLNDQKLIIQALEHPMNLYDVIPLGVKHFSDGKYIISLHEKEGVFNGQKIYLKDKYLHVTHNLSQGHYEYEGLAGTFNDRFEIVFTKGSFTDTAFENTINKIDLQKIDHHIVVNSSIDAITGVEVFNLSGWSIYQRSDINQNEFKIPLNAFAKQIVVVRVQTETGEVVTQKFILK